MKLIISLFTLMTFCLSVPIYSTEPPPVEDTDTESPPDENSPVYATGSAPHRERVDAKPIPSSQKTKQIAAIILGTLATVTVGLLASGANTGKHIRPSAERKTK